MQYNYYTRKLFKLILSKNLFFMDNCHTNVRFLTRYALLDKILCIGICSDFFLLIEVFQLKWGKSLLLKHYFAHTFLLGILIFSSKALQNNFCFGNALSSWETIIITETRKQRLNMFLRGFILYFCYITSLIVIFAEKFYSIGKKLALFAKILWF